MVEVGKRARLVEWALRSSSRHCTCAEPPAAADRRAVTVQDDHVPGSEVVGVVALLPRIARSLIEVLEVA